ncbi:PUA domain-containing protein [Candidatus Nitrosotenuis uzonensis]|uniref:PUA domain protein n=1 Tax=Candidatus Nitrosotenuis uzonensis TaxID=1407055 RepID=V6AV22_9ARCH|nr:PUA domain-containing protein [Candidatus Nitrosotenuis uzonensis]CDI06404.1 putative PUA domain protein [Candidatus Nitrosotenuis uzonensis]
MDYVVKLKHTIDALFGSGVSKSLPKELEIKFSRKNGRIKEVYCKNKLLCTLRIDGGLAITPHFAQILLKRKKFKENCVEIDEESKPFVQDGKSVFCKHVRWAGKNILVGTDVPVLFDNKVIAVGRAVVNHQMMMDLERGVAVRIRDTLKDSLGE